MRSFTDIITLIKSLVIRQKGKPAHIFLPEHQSDFLAMHVNTTVDGAVHALCLFSITFVSSPCITFLEKFQSLHKYLQAAVFKYCNQIMEANETVDWRSKCTSVVERWSEARKQNLFTDVNFLVGEGEFIKSFSAHKNVLAFSSPVFEAMLFGALAEKTNPIAIVDIDPEAFNALLRHAYGEKISFPSVAYAAKTAIAADKYLMTDLQAAVENYVSKSNMDDPQFWDVITQNKFFRIPVVKKKCLEYIATNATALFKSYMFTTVSSEVVVEILQMDKIQISEFELLRTLVCWGVVNVQRDMKPKSFLEPFLRYIRFSCLTVDEFCDFLDCHPGILDDDDSLSIMKHLHKRTVYKLPAWCSASTKQRYG